MNNVLFSMVVLCAATPAAPAKVGYDDTPFLPGGKWRVHDSRRPQPAAVTACPPGAIPGPVPSDALALLGQTSEKKRDQAGDLSRWTMRDGSPATWKLVNGVLESGKGYIRTKDEFTDFQLHVEWASPKKVEGDGQKRGNSGVFLLGLFEVQVLDSYGNPTYADGGAAALYGQEPPLVNASAKPGVWQSYDIVFTAPRFKDGKLDRPAIATVLHNGVVVQNAVAFAGPTMHKKIGEYKPEMVKGPIELQDHGNPVRFRNIWIRPIEPAPHVDAKP